MGLLAYPVALSVAMCVVAAAQNAPAYVWGAMTNWVWGQDQDATDKRSPLPRVSLGSNSEPSTFLQVCELAVRLTVLSNGGLASVGVGAGEGMRSLALGMDTLADSRLGRAISDMLYNTDACGATSLTGLSTALSRPL